MVAAFDELVPAGKRVGADVESTCYAGFQGAGKVRQTYSRWLLNHRQADRNSLLLY